MLEMREYAQRGLELTAGQNPRVLGPGGDWRWQASLERMLELIGEAANRVPKDVQARFPGIPWAALVGMRNILIHAHDSVDPAKLWQAATVNVPELLKHLDGAMAQMPPFDT